MTLAPRTRTLAVDIHTVERLRVDGGPYLNGHIKSIPGARYDRTEATWHVPMAPPALLELREMARAMDAGLEATDAVKTWSRGVAAQVNALHAAKDSAGDGQIPGLFVHQASGGRWLAVDTPDFPGRLLLDETGTGKTRTVLEALTRLEEWPVLIVCPATVKDAWRREIEAVRPDLDVVVVGGSAAQRRKQLDREAHVYVINFESVRTHSRLRAYPGVALKDGQTEDKELNRPWAVVVADEAHRMKNPKAQQTMAMWGVAEWAARRWALTGTPVANAPDDLWALLRFLDPRAWPVKSAWVNRYCDTGYNFFGGFEVTGFKASASREWDMVWQPSNRRTLKAAALDLPPLVRGGSLEREVPLTPDQRRAYVEMAEDMIARVEDGSVAVSNVLTQSGRLMGLASAYGTVTEDERFKMSLPSNKIAAFLADYREGDFPESTVVAMASRQLALLLSGELDRLKIPHVNIHGGVPVAQRGTVIEAFQRGEVPLLVMTFGAGGTGITLTQAAQMVLLQRSWSAVEMKQAIDRVHRIGSEIHDTVTVIDYVSPGTVERTQMRRLGEKEDILQELVHDAATLRAALKGEL